MKHFAIVASLLVLSSCTERPIFEPVEIGVMDHSVFQRRGMGVLDSNGGVITSSHVIRDNLPFRISTSTGMLYPFYLRNNFRDRDIAYGVISKEMKDIPNVLDTITQNKNLLKKGDFVNMNVYRSGSLMRLSGSILELSGTILGYGSDGRVEKITGALRVDTLFFPGESGAPIFDTRGNLIDVVHVAGE